MKIFDQDCRGLNVVIKDFKTAGPRLKEDLCNIQLRASAQSFLGRGDYTLYARNPKAD
jgi:hypothetical protein